MKRAAGLGEQFANMKQQTVSYSLGMWAFLGSELMLFGALFLAYTEGRLGHARGFEEASAELHKLLGALNTAVLLTSSTTMAFAVQNSHKGNWKAVSRLLVMTAILGTTFLGIKGYEWSMEYHDGRIPGPLFSSPDMGMKLFYWFYFTMTGLHALHLSLGVVTVLVMAVLAHRRSSILVDDASPIVMTGLYWHLVDLIWFFLYPALYMVGGPK